MNGQIKSKNRVEKFGEVYTAHKQVVDMIGMLPDDVKQITSTYFEPACGNGNFLLEILKQKLERAKENSASEIGFMYLVVQAVMSIYGVDIQMDNVVECVDRLYDQVEKDYYEFVGHNPSDRFRWTIYSILGMNMTCGDSLSGTTDNGKPIMIYEWKIGTDGIIYCDGYRLSDLVAGGGELNDPINRKRYLWFISALSKALAA